MGVRALPSCSPWVERLPQAFLLFWKLPTSIFTHKDLAAVAWPTFPTCYFCSLHCLLPSTLPEPWHLLIIWRAPSPHPRNFGWVFFLSVFLLFYAHRHHLHVDTPGYPKWLPCHNHVVIHHGGTSAYYALTMVPRADPEMPGYSWILWVCVNQNRMNPET